MALTQAFNYSVEMEERVADDFNTAVCSWRQADGQDLSDNCKERLGL